MKVGKGRVAVFGEAGMFQRRNWRDQSRRPMGMKRAWGRAETINCS